jgi:predicted ATP-dependent serine protease
MGNSLADKYKPVLTPSTRVVDVPLQVFQTPHTLLNDIFSHDGGVVKEQVYFITGSSGAGKTTLLTQLQCELPHLKSAHYNRESSAGKIRSRNHLMNFHDNAHLDDEKSIPTLEAFLNLTREGKMDFIIVDSLQTAAADIPGGKLEREVEAVRMLIQWAKDTGGTVFVIGMVTKEEDFAGAQEAMQLVDAHLHLTFDKKANERYLEFQQKNRDGEVYKRVYYSFREDKKGIQFWSPSEWLVHKRGYTLANMVQTSMQGYIDAWKNHDDYDKFKAEMSKKQTELIKQGFDNQIEYQCALLIICQGAMETYFGM